MELKFSTGVKDFKFNNLSYDFLSPLEALHASLQSLGTNKDISRYHLLKERISDEQRYHPNLCLVKMCKTELFKFYIVMKLHVEINNFQRKKIKYLMKAFNGI